MTLDPVSVAVGVVATYAFSALLLVALCVVESRQAKKERDRELDRLLANVGVACIERPMNAKVN
ncbi:hypothetical protein LCGC14_2294370 [marine sediment metagenome]|uniref:Uncharacterized protein n=1 Tax=marine sediment metagenome TaxID=412755 RepID=A0A0F9FKE8_9ZZZZ